MLILLPFATYIISNCMLVIVLSYSLPFAGEIRIESAKNVETGMSLCKYLKSGSWDFRVHLSRGLISLVLRSFICDRNDTIIHLSESKRSANYKNYELCVPKDRKPAGYSFEGPSCWNGCITLLKSRKAACNGSEPLNLTLVTLLNRFCMLRLR